MNSYVKLGLVALIPVLASVILNALFKLRIFNGKKGYYLSQGVAGVVFGLIAVLGTEKGVPITGAMMNARDAAPLCAGLIFGAPAGIISGLIGGIERWFSVYWGVSSYTRVACTVSTIVVGFFGAIIRKYMFEDEVPASHYAFATGLVGETFHMVMVFVTNMSDPKTAFDVVKKCTIPMVSAVTLSVFIAVLVINTINHSNAIKQSRITLSEQFQKGLLFLIVVAFVLTSAFTISLQTRISNKNSEDLFVLNIEDIKNDVDSHSNENLLAIVDSVIKDISDEEINDEYLVSLANKYDVAEISVIDKNNIIVNSNVPEYINFDMSSGPQSNEFSCLLNGEHSYVQSYQATTSDPNVYRKYAGTVYKDGYVQVGYDAEEFQADLANEVIGVASYRHIGEAGGLVVADRRDVIVSNSFGLPEVKLEEAGIVIDRNKEEYTTNKLSFNEHDYYYMYTTAEGYTIIALLPVDEADFTRDISVYLNIFMEVLVFAGLFILVYFMIKALIVDNVRLIDNSLQKITDGNLDTTVDVRINDEFNSLSTGINTTVDSMKKLIEDANRRIDEELQYAKDIQFSSLPSIFPPFPDRHEFDIYALMDPAKEVGGDFYDFYFIDRDVIAFLVADVAGKGIPAALFMMRAKSIIKTYAEAGISVADIFTNANFNLCEGNDAGMFVTAWMGFLNIATGELKYANAGHNRPLVRRSNGDYEYLQGPAGFVLGGMEGIVYKEQNITLQAGDEIFLYTDGVPEATNINKELFNDNRLKEAINKYKGCSSQDIILSLKRDVDAFYEGAPQFDDMTMLSLRLLELRKD